MGKIFLPLLAVAFIVLKLTNVIDWSWWWVTAPIWVREVLGIIIFVYIKRSNKHKSSLQEKLELIKKEQERMRKERENNNENI